MAEYLLDGSISIHAPLAGRDRGLLRVTGLDLLFQSTRPLRGATMVNRIIGFADKFQSTRPLRGATLNLSQAAISGYISIHAPLAGRDRNAGRPRTVYRDFNPRAPCGARLRIEENATLIFTLFQSTRPLRGATGLCRGPQCGPGRFQSTRPLRGATGPKNYARIIA